MCEIAIRRIEHARLLAGAVALIKVGTHKVHYASAISQLVTVRGSCDGLGWRELRATAENMML